MGRTYCCWSSVAVRWPCCWRGGWSHSEVGCSCGCYCSLGMCDRPQGVCCEPGSAGCWGCCRGWHWGQGWRCSWSCAEGRLGSSSAQRAAGAGCCWRAGGGGSVGGRRVKTTRTRTPSSFHPGCQSGCGWTPGRLKHIQKHQSGHFHLHTTYS